MRFIIVILIMLFVVLQYEFWFAQGGVISAWKLTDHIATAQQGNDQLKQRNDALRADITDLKSGNTAIQERARSELGMIKRGETFYQVVQHVNSYKN